jgi:hypothetical protein
MKLSLSAVMVFAATVSAAPLFGQSPQDEPTRQEITEAYSSKSGESGFPGVRWETWRINKIRGWTLHFKRLSESRFPGVLTLQYQAIAKKSGLCAEYQITDTKDAPRSGQIKPILVVEPNGVMACR